MAKKEEPKQSLRSRVASKFTHEDAPEVKKVTDEDDAAVTGFRTPKETETPTYSVGAGAPPEAQKRLQATIETDRKALKKKQS